MKNSILDLKDTERVRRQKNIIAVSSADNIDLIVPDDLLYLEADGNYTTFHLFNKSTIISSRNLGNYEKLLDSDLFFRIHNKFIVNINMVKSISTSSGSYCEIINGKKLPIAKRRKVDLYRFLNLT